MLQLVNEIVLEAAEIEADAVITAHERGSADFAGRRASMDKMRVGGR